MFLPVAIRSVIPLMKLFPSNLTKVADIFIFEFFNFYVAQNDIFKPKLHTFLV